MNACVGCGRLDLSGIAAICSCGEPFAPARVVPKRPKRQWVRRPGQRERIYKRDGYRCVSCGTTEDLTLDHRIPKSRGGSNTDDNLQTMCTSCNQAKGDSMPAELAAV